MSFGKRVTTTTQDYFAPRAVNTVLKENEFAARMLSKAKMFRGEQMRFPVIVSKNNTGQSFSGLDTFDTSASDTRIRLSFAPKSYAINVTLPLDEVTANMGSEEQVLNLVDIEMETAAQGGADDIGTMFYGTGAGKDFLGLEAIVDDGTNAATYGGQSRTTYSTLNSTVTASGGTLTLAKMTTLWNNISVENSEPDAIFTTPTVWQFYEELLQANERIIRSKASDKLMTGALKNGLEFKGVPVLRDNKCTSGVMYMLSMDYLQWYGRKFAMAEEVKFKPQTDANPVSNVKGLGFSWTGWKKPVNQAAISGQIMLYGELISKAPNKHGKLTGITSV